MNRKSFLMALLGLFLAPFKVVAACKPAVLDMFGPICTPIVEKSKAVVKKATKIMASAYRPVFNVNGDFNPSDAKLSHHCRSAHGINTSGMSRSQMFIAHDQAHGVRVAIPQASVGGCPGGKCPVSRRRR